MATKTFRGCAFLAAGLSLAAPASAAPAYQYLQPPSLLAPDFGEPSIAFNPARHSGLYQSGLKTLRYTLPEYRKDDALNPGGLPEVCDTVWEDVSPPNQTTTLDPIGVGDPVAGRYYASQLAVKSSLLNYTDDDGATWHPSTGGSPGASGIDHQSVGWAPYVAGGLARPLTAYPHAIYYCAQDSDNVETRILRGVEATSSTAGYANCARSDDGGATFLPPVTTYTTLECDGLHGHVRAAPDGTVYLPNKNCITAQGVVVSTDNGTTWAIRHVTGSLPGRTDPQISLASDGTGYFCYTNGDGHPHAAVTHDRGLTWVNDRDLGLPVGVVTAVFTQGTAGDADRAACGFIGTTTSGNSESEDFPGIWHAYIAVTYDAGLSWSVVNAAPDHPAQGAGGICTAAQFCGSNRNLLDFNDMTIDDRGRPLYGFADGCTGFCDLDPNQVGRGAQATILRMAGGKSLYSRFDQGEPHAPQAACLSGQRYQGGSELWWQPPAYAGGAPLSGYRIYRGTAPTGNGTLIASTGANPQFTDSSADSGVADYYYTVVAVNAAGASVHSNRIRLPLSSGTLTETACVKPGLTIFEDPEGDASDHDPAHDALRLSVSQPASASGDYALYFHLKVTSLATVPAATTWSVNFCSPAFPCVNPDPFTQAYGADNQYYTVRMSTVAPASAAAPAFEILQPVAGGASAESRTVVAARADSRYDTDGTISIGVNAADLGLPRDGAGSDRLRQFQAAIQLTTQLAGVTSNVGEDSMPNDGVGTGEFVTLGLDTCSPNTPPLAALASDVDGGPSPLDVVFDASASSDAEDAIAEYTFDFGDGSAPVTQVDAVVSHTFEADGAYDVSVRVRDARGLQSPVPAMKLIRVGVVPPPKNGNNFMGGGAVPAGLLAFGLCALAWRTRRGSLGKKG